MDYAALTQKLVADVIKNRLPGLTKKVDVHYVGANGTYDPETDAISTPETIVPDVTCVAAKTTFQDAQNYSVVMGTTKLIVPGTSLPAAPAVETDFVIMDAVKWHIHKSVQVPGGSVWLVFIELC